MALSTDQQEQAAVLAEALRQAFNPGTQDRMQMAQRPPPHPEQVIACVSPSGARFNAVVVASREFPEGRVVKLTDYKYPYHPELQDHYDMHRESEFKFPGGSFTIRHTGGEFNGQLTQQAKRYLTQSTWLFDLQTYVGKGFDPSIRADLQDSMRKMRERQAKEHAEFMAKQQAEAEKVDEKPKAK